MISVQNTPFTGQNDLGQNVPCSIMTDYVFQDATGNRHNLGLSYYGGQDPGCNITGLNDVETTGGEGPIVASTTSTWSQGHVNAVTVTDGDGTRYAFPPHFPVPAAGLCGRLSCATWMPSAITDRNGNQISITSSVTTSSSSFSYVDTIGRTALSVPTFGSNPDLVSVSGFSNPYQINWTTVSPHFSVTMTDTGGTGTCIWPNGAQTQPSMPVVSSIVLPNGQQFTFQYDATYGTVSKIVYPTGGYVRYVWGLNSQSQWGTWQSVTNNNSPAHCDYKYDIPAIQHRYVSFDGVTEVLQQDFAYSTNWTGQYQQLAYVWASKQTTVTTHDLVRGTTYSTTYTYSPTLATTQPNTMDRAVQLPVESTVVYSSTSGTTLRTVNKTWANERVLTQKQTILDNNQVAETDWFYDSNGTEQEIEHDDYDYGLNAHGSLLRKTQTSYVWDDSSYPNQTVAQALATAHIVDRPSTITVSDRTGIVAGASFRYDSVANLTNYLQWLNQTGTSVLTTTHSYDAYGNILSTTDPANYTTNYSYADNFAATCSGVSSSNAYLTQITYPTTGGTSHVEHFQYNCPTGKLASATDQNNNPTSYQYNDPLNRLTDITYPSGFGTSHTSYSDTPGSVSIETQRKDSSGITWADSVDLFDGIFRPVSHSNASGESSPWNRADTCYDGDSRKRFVTYPYQTSTDTGTPSCSGAGDTFVYDAIGRVRTVTHSDSSVVATNYTGRGTDMQDEGNGTRAIERVSQVDGLGRLVSVCEVTNQAQQGISASSCGLDYGATGFLTTYAYNGRGDLTAVSQGSVGRSFQYDMLSRLTSANNPEAGAISYQYDSDSNCPLQPSYAGELISETDARSIRRCFKHDELHRLTSKTYSDSTPAATYSYDETTKYGRTLTNTIGRKSSESTASPNPTGEVFGYDAMGDVVDNSQCTPQNCANSTTFAVTYPSYTVLGSPFSYTNGAGVTIGYGYNSAGALYNLSSSLNDANHPPILLNTVHYDAYGHELSATVGTLPVTDTRTYTPRGWLSTDTAVAGTTTGSTGTITVSGSERNRIQTNATPGQGTVTISNSERSTQVVTQGATQSTGTVTITGSEHKYNPGDCPPPYNCYVYDSGSVSITLLGTVFSVNFAQGSTISSIATALVTKINGNSTYYNMFIVSSAGGVVSFTSRGTGSGVNYPLSVGYSYDSGDPQFQSMGPSFVPAASGMSGGQDAVYTTVYDTGTVGITVNGYNKTVSYGQSSTSTTVASALASAFHNDGNAPVDGTSSGTVVTLTSRTSGAGTNYSLTASSATNNGYFTGTSFPASPSGANLTGGTDATLQYDAGTVTATINGTQSTTTYGQGDTNTTVATHLAAAINANSPVVNASSSGNVVTLTSKTQGNNTNYSLSASSASTAGFSPVSFTTATSGMSGGTGGPLYSVSVNYFNNGDIQSSADSANGPWSYTYDDFNRLNTAVRTDTTHWGCSESYDRYGNRWSQQPYGGTGYTCGSFSNSFGSNNRIATGYGYDAAGDVTGDGTYTYTYDAEGRISAVSGSGTSASYVYNAEGQRVRKTSSGVSVDYLYDLAGHVITELNSSGGWNRGEVYAGGMHIATYQNGATYFTHSDWLGTERARSALNGTIYSTWTSYPFGEGSSAPNPGPTHFTGKERDAESGLDNFNKRYFGSSLGRFMTPDPLVLQRLPANAFFLHLGNPQSWNKYAYVMNNPLSLTDPTGLDFYLTCSGKDSATCQGGHVGTTDDKGKFTATVVTSAQLQDPKSGVTGTVTEGGVKITNASGTYTGQFINGTPASTLQGSGALTNFTFNITGQNPGNLLRGTWQYNGTPEQAAQQMSSHGAWTYPLDVISPFHPSSQQYRFSDPNDPSGPSIHISQPLGVGLGIVNGFSIGATTFPSASEGEFHVDTHGTTMGHIQDVIDVLTR